MDDVKKYKVIESFEMTDGAMSDVGAVMELNASQAEALGAKVELMEDVVPPADDVPPTSPEGDVPPPAAPAEDTPPAAAETPEETPADTTPHGFVGGHSMAG